MVWRLPGRDYDRPLVGSFLGARPPSNFLYYNLMLRDRCCLCGKL